MRAVVLVGGFGTRLRPLTEQIPKPMLPVGHLPIIERVIAGLARGGVDDVTLALGFRPEPFVAAFPDGHCAGARLNYAVEPEPLDTAGAIRFAAEHAGIDETFVVANGDVLTDLDVAELARFHRQRGAEATLHVIAVGDPSAFGVVALGDAGRVERFVEKPAPGTEPSNLINAGTYVLEPSVLARIPTGQRVSIERATFPAIAGEGGLFAMATEDYWVDTGRPELLLQANLDLLDGRRRYDTCAAVSPTAQVDPSARMQRAIVGEGCIVGAGADLRDAVLLPGARVGNGCRIQRSVVAGDVGAGAVVIDAVLGSTGRVAAGESLVAERRPSPS